MHQRPSSWQISSSKLGKSAEKLTPEPDHFRRVTSTAGLTSLNDGQRVSYDVITERGKQAAANLKLT